LRTAAGWPDRGVTACPKAAVTEAALPPIAGQQKESRRCTPHAYLPFMVPQASPGYATALRLRPKGALQLPQLARTGDDGRRPAGLR